MSFDHTDATTEAQEGKINIYNVVLSYVVEMNEHRSVLFTSVQMTGGTPSSFKEFLTAFFKLFTFTQSMLPAELREEISKYFKNNPRQVDSKGIVGTELSLKMQRELENQRMITLYEETIMPPFVEIKDDDENPDDLISKTNLNPVTKTTYQVSRRNPNNATPVKSMFKKKGGDK